MKYEIKITRRNLSFKTPATTSRGTYNSHFCLVVRISRPENPKIFGKGECSPLPGLSIDHFKGYEAMLRQICDMIAHTGEVPTKLLRNYPSMLFGIETAMAQLNAGGKFGFYDTPFAKGKDRIPINALVWMGPPEHMLAQAEEKISQGCQCIKLKIGSNDFDAEQTVIRKIRMLKKRDELEIRLDANGAYTPEEAYDKLLKLSPYGIHSIEQPIKPHQWEAMADLCRHSPIPIALDEELIGLNIKEMKENMLDAIHPQYIVIKPTLHGGLSGAREWVELARKRGIGSWITSALEANIGLNAVAQLAADVYGPKIKFPQGLGTGKLYVRNFLLPIYSNGFEICYRP